MRRARAAMWIAVTAGFVYASVAVAAPAPRVPRHFKDLNDDLPDEVFTAVAVAPNDADVLFAGNDGFVFKSDDGGDSWRPVLSFPRGLSVEVELALEDPTFALGADGVPSSPDREVLDETEFDLSDVQASDVADPADAQSYSDDAPDDSDLAELQAADSVGMPTGDADMQARYSREGPGVRRIHVHEGASGTIWVATARGLFRSLDQGESFTEVELGGGPLVADVRDVGSDPKDPRTVFLATAAGLFVSRDAGATFARGPGRTGAAPALALAVTRAGAEIVVVVSMSNGLLKSRDGGLTFRELLLKGASAYSGAGVVAFDRGERTIYVGTTAGLYVGERDAAILEQRAALVGRSILAISPDPRRERGVALGVAKEGVVESEDSALTAVSLADVLPATAVYDIARPPGDTDSLIVATERGVFRYVEGTGILAAEDRAMALRKMWRREPTLEETARAALDYARVSTSNSASLIGRMRMSELLPRLRLRFNYTGDATGNRILYSEVDPALQLETDTDELQQRERSRYDAAGFANATGTRWQVVGLVVWDTDRIFFHPREPAAIRELGRQNTQERRILDNVRSLYTARRRAMSEIYLNPPVTPRQLSRSWLRLAELTSLLAAATGGRFVEDARARGAELAELEAASGSLFNLDPK